MLINKIYFGSKYQRKASFYNAFLTLRNISNKFSTFSKYHFFLLIFFFLRNISY